ncbi:putative disease resistance RPP13-like protein 1 [Vitis riparia]|uniref:putative disease resistance RPP13-like protein 1 n=1 Tax=Vitis riparia TaxID=96939 RepID=UPI00155AEFAD|nr:putative disease resistance RPP13-like protein 1 [Vitis riparia]XP_034680740.1 putative disease resistance RPP13-like protein 1 [Vitis riparia]XP_034680741.1 putative disease resistance RPP13-like protein 1 [Vitis riparia]XP_034680742.1 putative disease resistance RPP13-like protein 1 [Vitis riparia]XP_034680743.1 putative disease resistance RPP13-like protein 1 [Vitis riparia]XP_034680744.1 putative disease resistance RPP13-like protein 1 [Vitis riparia]XP_034680745.1 putative disease res
MFVAEAAVSSIFNVVLEKLVAAPLLDYARSQNVEATLQKWKRILLHIEAVLTDAEQKQIRDRAVKLWLDDLKSLAYDMEDVLDEFNTEANRQILIHGPQASTSQVHKLIPTCFAACHPTSVIFNAKVGGKIKKITRELDAVAKRKHDFHLREGVGGLSFEMEERLQTTSLVDESSIYGRDAKKEAIIQFLLSEKASRDNGDNGVSVVPIVGMGGVGKTTLAQIIYNDKRVESHFDTRIWVCVSDRFDVTGITKAILESVTHSSTDSKNLESLQNSLKNGLNGKRFFLVLDDVWNEKPQNWDALKAPFRAGAQGSMIVVTTRNEDVASIMRTTASSHHLDVLSYEECRLLFAKHAFAHMNTNIRQKLEPIGEKIVRKCRGLPLAAKSLGSLLHTKQDENAWNEVLNNDIWDFPIEQSDILPALYLSYHYLPPNLKRCFAYCSIFPKDYKFEKRKLVLLWMAEGLLGGSNGEKIIEDFGNTCFENLLSRSFFQRSIDDESLFMMHDLIHDLAQFVSGKFCSWLDDGKKNQISKQTRHSSYIIAKEFELSMKFNPFYEAHNLRTFLPVHTGHQSRRIFLSKKISNLLLPTLKCLRVLSLAHYHIVELPHSIGTLKHLRYLDLSRTSIRRLPESITNLFNLQTLMLSNCHSLTHLPTKMGKLINLRHLDISDTSLKEMPMGMEGLKRLRTLTAFAVGEDRGAKIKELRDMSHLGGRLCISKLRNVVDAMDVFEANLKGKERLDELVMQWDGDATARDLQKETTVLEKLQPHNNLKELTIEHYCGEKFPNWLGEHSFTNMVSMQLHDCKNCSSLPSLGQLGSLKELSIMRIDGVQKVGQEFYGNIGSSSFKPFEALEILRFEKMLEWEEWVCREIEFPCLKELYIKICPKLKKDLPKHLPKLTKLEIRECKQLVCCLPMAPSIRELMLVECDDVVVRSAGSLTSLASLDIRNVCKIPDELGQLNSLVKLSVYRCPELKEMPPILHNLTSLKHLDIRFCDSLLSCSEMGLPPMLERLQIVHCPILKSLSEGMIQNNTTLQQLYISCCKKLELSLPEDMTHNHYAFLTQLNIFEICDSLTSFPLAFFTKLEYLHITNCGNLESLYIPDGLHHVELTSLQSLEISNCPNLVSFPRGGLPTPNLRRLSIESCKKLKSLPQGMHALLTSLEYLHISSCPEIDSFPEGGLPTNLSDLHIGNCNKLLACRMEWGLQTLPFLRTLEIEGYEKERFPEERFLPSTLTFLQIRGFPNLKSLDNKGLQHLTSLETLEIWKCGKLKSFPKQGLPSSLSRLYIRRCPLLKKRCQRDEGKEWPNISHIPCIVFDRYDKKNKEVILS